MLNINVTEEDLKDSDPIKAAVLRQEGLDVVVDSRYLFVKGNEANPRRLPLSAEQFQVRHALGGEVKPFSFKI
jgi:hypothetical protein